MKSNFSNFRVQYDGCANRWTFHPAALVKVCTFHVGDLVTIINDAAKVQVNISRSKLSTTVRGKLNFIFVFVLQQLQKGHGEWVETMRNVSLL